MNEMCRRILRGPASLAGTAKAIALRTERRIASRPGVAYLMRLGGKRMVGTLVPIPVWPKPTEVR